MHPPARIRHLSFALRAIGLVFIFALYPLTVLWPSGWSWHTGGRSEYLEMILGLYATLGACLWFAASAPMRHVGLIGFTVWSSVVHGLIMAVQSVQNPAHVHHLYGDVAALALVAGVLAFLCPASLRPWDREAPPA